MLHEILFSLLGFPGDVVIDTGSTYSLRKGLDLLSKAEQDQINRIVPLGWYYTELQAIVQNNQTQWKLKENIHDRNQSYRCAIALGINELIDEYAEDITYLEQYILSEGPVPLSYFYQHLQKYLIVMPIIYDIAREIDAKEIQGCEILDFIATVRSGMPLVNEVLRRFLYHTRAIFIKQCLAWSLYGELDDSGKEFMIQKRVRSHDHHHNQVPSSYHGSLLNKEVMNRLQFIQHHSHDHIIDDNHDDKISFDWLSSYYLRLEFLPESQISLRLASKILFCGKAVKLLQLSSKESYRYQSILKSSGYHDFYQYFAGKDHIIYDHHHDDHHNITSSIKKSDAYHHDDNDHHHVEEEIIYFDDPMMTKASITSYLLSNGFHKHDLDRIQKRYHLLYDHMNTTSSFEYFEPMMNDIHDVLSKNLWTWLRDEMRFISFLHAMRSVYLLGRGEFFQFLLDQILDAILYNDHNHHHSYHHDHHHHDVISSINEQVRADVILEDALEHVVKLLGYDELVLSNMMTLRITSSQFIYPSTIISSQPSSSSSSYRLVDDHTISLLGYARYHTSSSSSYMISICACDQITRMKDDKEDAYHKAMMIDTPIKPQPTTSHDDDDDHNIISHDTSSSSYHQPSSYYLNGGVSIKDQRYIAKGFTSYFSFVLDWNHIKAILIPNHTCFIQTTSQRPFASPLRNHHHTPSSPSYNISSAASSYKKRMRSVCLGSLSLVLHNDRYGAQSIGAGAYAVEGLSGAISIGVSIHARVSYDDTSSEPSVQYQYRIFVSYMHPSSSSSSSAREGKINQQETSSSSLSPADAGPSSSSSSSRHVSHRGYQYEVLADRYVDMSSPSDTMRVDVEYNRDFISSPSAIPFPSSSSIASSIASSSSSMKYMIRARLSSDHHNNHHNDHHDDDKAWDISFPIDLSKYIRLQSGQSYASYLGSSLDLNQYTSSSSSSYMTSSSSSSSCCLGIDMMKMMFDSKGALSSYPIASTYTSTRHPDTTLQLDKQVKRFRLYMNLKLTFKFPDTFRVVMDSDSIACYGRIFSMLMKIRLVGNALEKLWLVETRLSNDRVFCHLRHSMLFFISNLQYYLQVDVIDSEFASLIEEIGNAVDMQVVLKAHRNFLADLARISFIDNIVVQESFDRIMQVCLRFLSICRIIQSEIEPHSSSASTVPVIVPPEELDAVRREFFTQVSYLFNIMTSIDNKGFMFRLDFNGYLSQVIADNLAGKFSKSS